MKPIYITVGNELPLVIIPDSQAHLNGHTILTYTYNIYKNPHNGQMLNFRHKENFLHLEENHDPNYMGYITFEQPGSQFTYSPVGHDKLTTDELGEVVELIGHYRDTKRLWRIE